MDILLTGTSHKFSPVEIREQIAFSENEIGDALHRVQETFADEAVLISTCNRTELYIVPKRSYGSDAIAQWLNAYKSVVMSPEHMFTLQGFEAAKHLFDVTSGIDSQIIGDIQITGQIRDAYQTAQESGTTGKVLSRLFDSALRCAKRVKNETELFAGAVSLSYVAVELARKIFYPLSSKSALVIGAGETGELTASNLHAQGVRDIAIANRTEENTHSLITKLGIGTALTLSDVADHLHEYDIVIVCTGAPEHVITYEMAKQGAARRGGATQLIVDLSVPRNVDPRIDSISSIFSKDLNDLTNVIETNLQRRTAELPKAEIVIADELGKFIAWCNLLPVTPVIARLKEQSEQIMRSELEKNRHRFKPEDFEHIEKLVGSVVRKIIGAPMSHLLDSEAEHPELLRKAEYIARLFNLDE